MQLFFKFPIRIFVLKILLLFSEKCLTNCLCFPFPFICSFFRPFFVHVLHSNSSQLFPFYAKLQIPAQHITSLSAIPSPGANFPLPHFSLFSPQFGSFQHYVHVSSEIFLFLLRFARDIPAGQPDIKIKILET